MLWLEWWTHVADLVQEDRPAIDLFKLADPPLIGARKRSAFMTEQLAFQERLAERGTS